MELPKSVRFVVIGAGVHGLSTAYHLAKELKARGEGSGEDILIVDKTGIAAGASGIACGVVRNNYFQPAMSRAHGRLRRGLGVRPEALHYHGSGYIALGPAGAGAGPDRGLRAPAARSATRARRCMRARP